MLQHNLLIFYGTFRFKHRSRKDAHLGTTKLKICGNNLRVWYENCKFRFTLVDHFLFCCSDNKLSELIKEAIEEHSGKTVKYAIPRLRNYHLSGRLKEKNFQFMKSVILPSFIKNLNIETVGITTEPGASRDDYPLKSREAQRLLDPDKRTAFLAFFVQVLNSSLVKFQQSGSDLCFTVITSKYHKTSSDILDILESFDKEKDKKTGK